MDDHVAVVKQHPPRLRFSFAPPSANASTDKGFFNSFNNGVDLAGRLGGTDHEVVRNVDDLADIEHDNIACVLIDGSLNGEAANFQAIQRFVLQR